MPSSSIFSLPVPVYRQSKVSLKDGPHARKRKRAEFDDNDETKSIDASRETDRSQYIQSQQGSQFSEYSAVLTPAERSQYRVAGQPFDESPPMRPFPHAPQSRLDNSSKKIQSTPNRLASLGPPVYAPIADSRNLSLHQQHLAAVTALLHRALSERDFARAGRALSLILRDTIGGQGMDIRAEGRWGIGAEILLRQGTEANYNRMDLSTVRPNNTEILRNFEQGPASYFTRKGFEDSMKYYERLVVQYPFHMPNPGAVNALDFYHAMFGLWIYIVQEESKLNNELRVDYTFGDVSPTEGSLTHETKPKSNLASSRRTLALAREIATRMDSCMTTIPYSDDIELIRLSGMVSSWIANLIDDLVENQSSLSDENEDDDQADVVAGDGFSQSPTQRWEDDPNSALRLEADQARRKAVEMQRKLQGHLDRFG
jgi:hypothetical protein